MHSVKWKKIGRRRHVKNESGMQNWKTNLRQTRVIEWEFMALGVSESGKRYRIKMRGVKVKIVILIWILFCVSA